MPKRLKISVTATAMSSDLRTAVVRAQAIGFDGLLLSGRTSEMNLFDLSVTGRREVRHLVATSRLEIVGVQADVGLAGFTREADVDRILHALDKLLEATAGLGAPLVTLDLGRLPAAPKAAPPPKPAVTEAMMGLLILPSSVVATPPPVEAPVPVDQQALGIVTAALIQLGTLADKYGVMIAFGSSLSNLAALTQAVRSADCPYFGIDLDPVAVLRDDMPFDDVFNTMGHDIRHVRGRDAVRGDAGRTKATLLARGDTDWRGLLDRLDHAAYSGAITIDPGELLDPITAATVALKQLRAMNE